MDQATHTESRNSWLSLVAEAAGVSGTAIMRVGVRSLDIQSSGTIYLQVLDRHGHVCGATRHRARAGELFDTVFLDLGFDWEGRANTTLIAWVDCESPTGGAWTAEAPEWATTVAFEPTHAMKLMLTLENPMTGPLAA
jgi:hypothetical protein